MKPAAAEIFQPTKISALIAKELAVVSDDDQDVAALTIAVSMLVGSGWPAAHATMFVVDIFRGGMKAAKPGRKQ